MRRYAWTGCGTLRALIFLAMLGTIIGLVIGCGGDKDVPDPGADVPDVGANASPIAYPPFIPGDPSFGLRDRVTFDLRYREHGCDASGAPTGATGAWDPDGDELEYRVTCEWSVFAAMDGGIERINGRWISFPTDDRGEQVALCYLWIGHTGDEPLHPTIPQSCGEAEAVPFTYTVRDGRGGEVSRQIKLGS